MQYQKILIKKLGNLKILIINHLHQKKIVKIIKNINLDKILIKKFMDV